MPSSWRWKTYLVIALTILSGYLLTPTFGGFKGIREATEKNKVLPPSFLKIFPEKEMNLGLDLIGGIYIELEVQTEDAISNHIDLTAGNISRFAHDEGIPFKRVERDYENNRLLAEFENSADHDKFKNFIYKNYKDNLQFAGSNGNIYYYTLTPEYRRWIKDTTISQAVETIRNRIDRYGVSEPSIHKLGEARVAIELPGISDPDRAIDIIKKAGKLEFKLVDKTMSDEDVKKLVAEVRKTGAIPEGYSEESVNAINQSLKGKIPADSEILFEIQHDPVTKKVVGGIPYLLKRKAYVTGDMLKNVKTDIYNNEPYVSLSFDQTGTKIFAALTKENIGERLAIILDNNVSKAPVIQSEIPNGEARITLGWGSFADLKKEAEDLTLVLKEGALPASFKEVTKTIVGPSLGLSSIKKGINATIVAGIAVILFMVIYYRLSGLLASVALIFNVIYLMAILSLFQATLTLPGIAGIVLTVGMAVDANVLILERIREEIRVGKTTHASVEAGYSNAMSAILDSNITTFLAGVVLYQFGTGPVRGFAVTLMVGIITTLFTAIVITRIVYDYLTIKYKIQRLSI